MPNLSWHGAATVVTPWGSSEPFELTIYPPPPAPTPLPPLVIDVDEDCGGDVAEALAKAANSSSWHAIVQLGPHVYTITRQLTVPNRTSVLGAPGGSSLLAYVLPLPPVTPPHPKLLPAALTVGSGVTLRDFSLSIDARTPMQSGRAPYIGVWLPPNEARLVARRINVTLSYTNVSNALRLEGEAFELTDSVLLQAGACGGTKDSDRSFQESVTLYVHAAREGLIARNTIGWRCSAFDLDVSERVIFEQNNITCLETGTVPHGNSLSAYDWHAHPWSRAWYVARNHFVRPPCRGAIGSGGQCGGPKGEDNWVQRETLTTDGSGGWAVGHIVASEGATVQLNWTAWTTAPRAGCRLLVIDGPGVGQSRAIIDAPTNGTLVLSAPLDGHVATGVSLLAVVNDVADKLVVGNSFTWTEVVQAYGLTLRFVAADNIIASGNFRHTGGGATGGILGATGECYHGIGVVFFTEFVHNRLTDSDGINLRDGGGSYFACGGYQGPWVRWSILRRNTLSGVSLASVNATLPGDVPSCAGVTVVNSHVAMSTTDVVAEHQTYACPASYHPATTKLGEACAHCVER